MKRNIKWLLIGLLLIGLTVLLISKVWLSSKNNSIVHLNHTLPTKVSADTKWRDVSCGNGLTTAIKTDGTLWVWGDNDDGQLGLGDTISRTSPAQVGTDTNWKQVACGGWHILAIKTDGTLWAWGDNWEGQLGLGDHCSKMHYSPVQVGIDTNWKQVACGDSHTLAIKTDGTLWAWGHNWEGQLGLGSPPAKMRSPVQVGTDTNWKQVASRDNHTLVIKTDGTLWAWGHNWEGRLGLGDTISRTSPAQVGTDTNWKQVACGYNHTLAIKNDLPGGQAGGTLWAWGWNGNGILGLGDTISRTSPAQVGTDTNWKQVSCGDDHTLAIKTDLPGGQAGGTLWGWGRNYKGELGIGDTDARYSPVQVGTDTNWKQVSCGDDHTLALKTDGSLWAWGNNDGGQLGLGDTTDRTTPTQVGQ